MSEPGTDDETDIPYPTANGGAIAFVVVALLAVGTATVQAFDFPERAGLAPLTVGIPTTLIIILITVRELRHFKRETEHALLKNNAYFWMLIYTGSFYVFGALGALITFSIGLIRVRGKRTWKETILFTVISSAAFFLLTETILGESLYRGWFMEQLR